MLTRSELSHTPIAPSRRWRGRTNSVIAGLVLMVLMLFAVVVNRAEHVPEDEEVPVTEDAEVLLHLDFEEGPVGIYTGDQAKETWSNSEVELETYRVNPKDSLSIEKLDGSNVLVRSFARGSFNSSDDDADNSALLRWRLADPRQELLLSYRVRTDPGFEPGRGGKLPGLCGGTCPAGGEHPTDESRKGRNDPDGYALGWSSRNMWVSDGGFSQYVYSADQTTKYGTATIYEEEVGYSPQIGDGEWHTIQQYVRMNDPGRRNGVITASIDGQEFINMDRVRFRDDNSFAIDSLLFSNFFGGHEESWESPKDQRMYFDDIVLSAAS